MLVEMSVPLPVEWNNIKYFWILLFTSVTPNQRNVLTYCSLHKDTSFRTSAEANIHQFLSVLLHLATSFYTKQAKKTIIGDEIF